MSQFQRIYFYLVVLSLVINFSPFNFAAYILPFFVFFVLMIFDRKRKLISKLILFGLSYVLFCSIHALIRADFSWANSLIFIITSFGLVAVLLIPNDLLASNELYQKLLRVIPWIILFEGLWGLTQVVNGWFLYGTFDSFTGDVVEGTIHPQLLSETSYSNVMFAIQIAFLLLIIAPDLQRSKYRLHAIVGAIVLIFASVMHVIFMLITSILFVLIFFLIRFRSKHSLIIGSGLLIVSVCFLLIVSIVLPQNFQRVQSFSQAFFVGDSDKGKMFQRLFSEMPNEYPQLLIMGLGPGQFSSRAGLIGTEKYFGGFKNPRDIPFYEGAQTKPQELFLMDLWTHHYYSKGVGSTQAPHSSWIANISEFGMVPIMIFSIWFTHHLLKMRRKTRFLTTEQKIRAVAISSSILLFFLLGFQENNWEVPQAWFSEMLILKVSYVVFQKNIMNA